MDAHSSHISLTAAGVAAALPIALTCDLCCHFAALPLPKVSPPGGGSEYPLVLCLLAAHQTPHELGTVSVEEAWCGIAELLSADRGLDKSCIGVPFTHTASNDTINGSCDRQTV